MVTPQNLQGMDGRPPLTVLVELELTVLPLPLTLDGVPFPSSSDPLDRLEGPAGAPPVNVRSRSSALRMSWSGTKGDPGLPG